MAAIPLGPNSKASSLPWRLALPVIRQLARTRLSRAGRPLSLVPAQPAPRRPFTGHRWLWRKVEPAEETDRVTVGDIFSLSTTSMEGRHECFRGLANLSGSRPRSSTLSRLENKVFGRP